MAGMEPAEVLAAIESLDVEALANLPLDDALRAWQVLENANRCLGVVRSELERLIALDMPAEVVVTGSGVFTKQGRKDRTQWDKEALLSAVLDSRLVDPRTGEIADESPLQKVLHVYNLPAPRVTALRDRGIDADQFCRSEFRGYSIRNEAP